MSQVSQMRKVVAFCALISGVLACSVSVDTGLGDVQPTPTIIVQPTDVAPIVVTPTPQADQPTIQVPTLPAGAETASVTYVIDGDTIDISMNGQDYRVRYVGMNTPERDEPCYEEATNANRALVEDQIVTLVRDVSETDTHGRLLRYVYVGDVFVNAQLVAEGWAEARRYRPDDSQYDYFDSLEAIAADQGLGCWDEGVFER